MFQQDENYYFTEGYILVQYIDGASKTSTEPEVVFFDCEFEERINKIINEMYQTIEENFTKDILFVVSYVILVEKVQTLMTQVTTSFQKNQANMDGHALTSTADIFSLFQKELTPITYGTRTPNIQSCRQILMTSINTAIRLKKIIDVQINFN